MGSATSVAAAMTVGVSTVSTMSPRRLSFHDVQSAMTVVAEHVALSQLGFPAIMTPVPHSRKVGGLRGLIPVMGNKALG
jgi:hypothetical protein